MKKLSFQKIFCFLSILFILSCCVFYGGRFVKLFLESKKEEIKEKDSLIKKIRENNEKNNNYKTVNGINYFTGNDENNYLMYSNILWRIIKVNSDNSLTVISDSSLTSLAFSKSDSLNDSKIFTWLNKSDKELSGILENSLNNVDKYLQKTISCTDKLEKLSNNPCEETNDDNYITLLSVPDYLNIGSKDSYLKNGENFYLSNTSDKDKVWYVNEDGDGSLSTGNDILGIRPVITIKANVDYVSGDGTKDKPYKVDNDNSLFGSYVKLGNDTWRIYEVNDDFVRLMLNDYLKVNGSNLTHIYSNNSSYHNDTTYGSLAYYLNNDYLNSLSYKDKIKERKWSNGYYNSTTDYDYTNALKNQIDTKVATMSIGNIFLNANLNNYFTMTGSTNNGSMVYTINKNKKLYPKSVNNESNVIPTISIDKELLKKGNGTIDSPFEME